MLREQRAHPYENLLSLVMPEQAQIETCELWPFHDDVFADRHYIAWWGKCAECGNKVVVTNRIHKLVEARASIKLVCVQCADRQVTSL